MTASEKNRPLRVFFVAGEASGDRLGAALMAGLKTLTCVEFQGVGGPLMQAESRADFFEKMAGFNLVAESVVHRMIEHGTTVARVFDFVISEPVSTTVPMAEWMEVENGRITKAWLYYDSAAFPTG